MSVEYDVFNASGCAECAGCYTAPFYHLVSAGNCYWEDETEKQKDQSTVSKEPKQYQCSEETRKKLYAKYITQICNICTKS